MGQVKTTTVMPLLNYLRRNGVEYERFVDQDVLRCIQGPGGHVSSELWLELYERAIEYTGDPDLPLKVGSSIQPSDYSVLGYAVMSCVSLGEAIAVMQRYERLVQNVNTTPLVWNGDWGELQWVPFRGPVSPIFMQLALASWTAMARTLGQLPDIGFRTHFAFPRPKNIETYKTVFGATPTFSQPVTKLVFPRALMDHPVVFSDPETKQVLLQKIEEQLRYADDDELVSNVRQRIFINLASGRACVEVVADELGMPPRTLQHKLKAADSSFRALLNEALFHRAREYLANPAISVGEVAFLLGYSEQSPFQHAFKGWAGMSPGEYRKSILRK